MPEELQEGVIVTPLKTDKVWKWIYPRYEEELREGNIVFKKTKTSGLIDEKGNQSKWNIYNKLWLSEQQEKGVVPSNLITEFENRQSASELKKLQLSFNYAKPERLIEYLLTISQQNKNAIVLDSFAGSGTTAHAVLNMNKADGGNRKYILVEMGDYADNITAERVKRVINGYGEGKNVVEGTGGDFSYYELGEPLFLPDGTLNSGVDTSDIRRYIWYTETNGTQYIENNMEEYYLGSHNDTAYYFYYDKEQATILDYEFLAGVTVKQQAYIIYADSCALSEVELQRWNITFKKIPRDIERI